jgi:CBS domain-containing protein
MQVRDVMTRDVQMIEPHSTLREAAEVMKRFDVGPLLVCDGGRLIGIITDRDITVRATAEGQDPFEGRVRDAMSMDVSYCFEDEDVEEAARVMQEKQVRRLPVLNRDRRLVGIVSLGDLAVHTDEQEACRDTLQAVSERAR